MKSKEKGTLNGYILVYKPDHPKAIKSSNFKGYVYEHVLCVEEKIGRPINKNEHVHHLDLNRKNNNPENLMVLEKEQHAVLHSWIQKGAPIERESSINNTRYCLNPECGNIVKSNKCDYCSPECYCLSNRKVKRPDKETLEKLINEKSFSALGREFGVSDTAVRKWARAYNLLDNK